MRGDEWAFSQIAEPVRMEQRVGVDDVESGKPGEANEGHGQRAGERSLRRPRQSRHLKP